MFKIPVPLASDIKMMREQTGEGLHACWKLAWREWRTRSLIELSERTKSEDVRELIAILRASETDR